jgi:hypothetical protein
MVRKATWGLAAIGVTTMGMLASPVAARAQDDAATTTGENADVMNKVVKLDLESADLYYALKLLFSQVKADFTLDNNLKGNLVTVKINQPFRIALSSVLKASGLPITYTFEEGVYRVIPIANEEPELAGGTDPEGAEPPPFTRNIPKIKRLNNINGIDIVSLFGGRPIIWSNSIQQNYGMNQLGGGGMMGGMGGGMMGGMGGMGGGMMGGMGGMGGGMMGGMGGMGGGMMGGMGGMGGGMGGFGGGMFGGGRGR